LTQNFCFLAFFILQAFKQTRTSFAGLEGFPEVLAQLFVALDFELELVLLSLFGFSPFCHSEPPF
jgi:hypothetical protein